MKEYRHILFLTFFTAVCVAVILLYNQFCRYQFYFLTDIFSADDLHLRAAAWAYLFLIRNSAGNNFCLNILNYLITLCFRISSCIAFNSFLYGFFGLFSIFSFSFVKERLLSFNFFMLARFPEYSMFREYQCFKVDMIILSETFVFYF